MPAMDLYAAAQRARAEHLRQLRAIVDAAGHHVWLADSGGWVCNRCDASLSDLAPLEAAAAIVAQPCSRGTGPTEGGAAG